MSKKTVAILMATYNGQKYLKEQIDSIINQSYQNWELWIQDDGSNDNTEKIIMSYMRKDNRIKFSKNMTGYHGAFLNFFTLIEKMKTEQLFDYYSFSDQDDIWEPQKLETLVRLLSKKESDLGLNVPLMCYSDMSLIDSKGNQLGTSLNDVVKIELKNKYQLFFSHSFIWGCSTMINRMLLEKVPLYDFSEKITVSHDHYLAKFAVSFGELYFINQKLVHYRRHGDNVTDLPKRKGNLNRIRHGIKILFERHADIYIQSLLFIDVINKNHFLNPAVDIYGIENSLKFGGLKACLYAARKKINNKTLIKTVVLYFILFTRGYKKYMKK